MFMFEFMLNFFLVYVMLFCLGLYMPMFTKKTEVFGVNIPEEHVNDEELKKLRGTYRRNYGISAGLVIVIFNGWTIALNNIIPSMWGILPMVLALSLNYVYIHNRVKKLKQRENWSANKKQVVMVDTSIRSEKGLPSYRWFWVSGIVVMFTWLFTMIQYPHLPNQIPGQFDLWGEIATYRPRDFFSVFSIPLTQLGIWAMMLYIFRVTKVAKVTINPANPRASALQNRIAKHRWSLVILVFASAQSLYYLYLQLNILGIIAMTGLLHSIFSVALIGVPVAALLAVAIITGQSGSRIKVEEEAESSKAIQRDDESYWKFGRFYYNPNDPSLWVEKRFGIGWTLNFGRPAAIAITCGILLVIITRLLYSFFTGR